MKKLLFGTVMCFALFSTNANSETQARSDAELTRLATIDFIYELIECTAYFTIIGAEIEANTEETNEKNEYQKLAENVAVFTYGLASDINMQTDALTAIMKKYGKEMGEKIENDGSNISILVEKHGEFCKSVIENPTGRLLFWMTKYDEQ